MEIVIGKGLAIYEIPEEILAKYKMPEEKASIINERMKEMKVKVENPEVEGYGFIPFIHDPRDDEVREKLNVINCIDYVISVIWVILA